jgi:hypothetical protein
VVDGEMAGEAELCRRPPRPAAGCSIARRRRDDRIGAARNGFVQDVVELAQLVAAKAEPGGIFALDPQPRSAEMRRQPLHRLERGRQVGKTQARKGGESVGQRPAIHLHCSVRLTHSDIPTIARRPLL